MENTRKESYPGIEIPVLIRDKIRPAVECDNQVFLEKPLEDGEFLFFESAGNLTTDPGRAVAKKTISQFSDQKTQQQTSRDTGRASGTGLLQLCQSGDAV